MENFLKHWSDHKAECKKTQRANEDQSSARKSLTSAQKNARIPKAIGSIFTVDAILFPADEDRPRVVQMGFIVKSDEDGAGMSDTWHLYDMSYFERLLGDRMIGRSPVYHKKPGGVLIPGGYTLELVYRDNYANDGSKSNRSIQNITGGNTVHDFRGERLGIEADRGAERGGIPSDLVVNIEEGDLEILRKYFIGYGRATTHHPDSLGPDPSNWPSNLGDFKVVQL